MSVEALALSLHFGERVIRRELTELEQLGILVRRVTRRRPGGSSADRVGRPGNSRALFVENVKA